MPIKCAINNVIKNLNKNNIHKYIYVYAKMQKKKNNIYYYYHKI